MLKTRDDGDARMSQAAAATDESRPTFRLARCLVILAVAVAMVGSSAPSPIYGLYQARLHLNHVWLTAIYGTYSVGTVFALFACRTASATAGCCCSQPSARPSSAPSSSHSPTACRCC
jgi:hypothetical protein